MKGDEPAAEHIPTTKVECTGWVTLPGAEGMAALCPFGAVRALPRKGIQDGKEWFERCLEAVPSHK